MSFGFQLDREFDERGARRSPEFLLDRADRIGRSERLGYEAGFLIYAENADLRGFIVGQQFRMSFPFFWKPMQSFQQLGALLKKIAWRS